MQSITSLLTHRGYCSAGFEAKQLIRSRRILRSFLEATAVTTVVNWKTIKYHCLYRQRNPVQMIGICSEGITLFNAAPFNCLITILTVDFTVVVHYARRICIVRYYRCVRRWCCIERAGTEASLGESNTVL